MPGIPPGAGHAVPEQPERETAPPAARGPTRFHGSVTLEATRVGRDAGRIAEEVISHLTGLVRAKVKVTRDIDAEVPDEDLKRQPASDNLLGNSSQLCRSGRGASVAVTVAYEG
jgi:hypothetical protein